MAEELLRGIAQESVRMSAAQRAHLRKVFEEKIAQRGWKVREAAYGWAKGKRERWTFVVETGEGEVYVVEIVQPRANLPPEWHVNETEITVARG
jgi:hypothetical protein